MLERGPSEVMSDGDGMGGRARALRARAHSDVLLRDSGDTREVSAPLVTASEHRENALRREIGAGHLMSGPFDRDDPGARVGGPIAKSRAARGPAPDGP